MSITPTAKHACCSATARSGGVGAVEGNRGILASKINQTDVMKSSFIHPAVARAEGPRLKRSQPAITFKMKGNELFKVAVRSMAEISRAVLEQTG